MKASDLENEGSELQHKVRSVSDLIRHIRTREADSETPNYNLFFGAGCSVSSGIRPAGELIEEWATDLYGRFNSKPPASPEKAVQYFETRQSSWYNKDNAYSSLFEKTYEFASQRRRFVEKEVDKTLPAIGYSYLTSLVSKKYFNTVFTTNFDDLINEAFYQFSDDRPILCAHDSSVKSISITSKRPKIIKLHGDYLFDDIKSTLRETESLEQNTKEKLIEFCKEFGLIVIGYSGNDRSIMDVLDFLTKQDNYLKNGVYWCLRKDDNINYALQKLFWKEKVYPVIIDGFDELFAEIHAKLMGGGLDFEANIKNSKLQKIKKKILDDSNPLRRNRYIRQDIENIKIANSKQEVSDFLSTLNNSGESDDLSLSDLRNLLEIEDLLNKKEYDKAYKLAEDHYYHSSETRDKSRYVSMLISISHKRDDTGSCLSWCDKLIDSDPNNISYIIKKSKYLNDLQAKYTYLSEKANKYNHKYKLCNESAKTGLSLIKNDPLNVGIDEENLVSQLDMSLKLNPSLSNHAWIIKFEVLNLIKDKINNNPSMSADEEGSIKDRIRTHVSSAFEMNDRDIIALNLKIKLLGVDEDFSESKKILTRLFDLYEDESASNKIYVNENIDTLIRGFGDYSKKVDAKAILYNFYEEHLQDKEIKNNARLLLSKSKYFISCGNQLSIAESYFLSALECPDIMEYFSSFVRINRCLGSLHTEKLTEVLDDNKSKLFEKYYYEYKYEMSISEGDYPCALEYLNKSFGWGLPAKSYYMHLSYLFILSEDYRRLIDFESRNREKIEAINSGEFTINYQYAAKQLGSDMYDPVCLRNIIAKSNDPSQRLAAFAVLGQNLDVKRIINERLEISYENYYIYKRWPIISNEMLEGVQVIEAA